MFLLEYIMAILELMNCSLSLLRVMVNNNTVNNGH